MSGQDSQGRQLTAAKKFLTDLAGVVNTRVSVRLWDGSMIPLGEQVEPDLFLSISGPGVIGSLIRRPTPENLLGHYAHGRIQMHGADVHTFIETMRVPRSRQRLKKSIGIKAAKALLPFLLARQETAGIEHAYDGDEIGHRRRTGENQDFIQFHYDVSNEFYALFLDPEMVYSCGYFTDWNNTVAQAQHDKLDMICRKLRLQPGERFLDIGCGWGALVCHAARNYGVQAHGITLSQRQLEFAQQKVRRLGLENQVTLELRDYLDLEGRFDKVASIGMVEHVGIGNMSGYMAKVASLLPDRGMFLNHGITRPAKHTAKAFRKQRLERRLLAKYIFPGGELDHLGHMLDTMEANRFEVHDVEGWRDHYALTCKLWSQRLYENRDEAVRQVGEEKYRMWLLYLAGVSLALGDGSACIFQTVATRHKARGHSGMPCTREHLYRTDDRPSDVRRAA